MSNTFFMVYYLDYITHQNKGKYQNRNKNKYELNKYNFNKYNNYYYNIKKMLDENPLFFT